MNDLLIQTISQWGTAGIMMIVAGYIIYDSWKKNKKNEKWFQENIMAEQGAVHSRDHIYRKITELQDTIHESEKTSHAFREEIRERVDQIDHLVHSTIAAVQSQDKHRNYEKSRMNVITHIAPTINDVLRSALSETRADHIALGLLHNGTQTLSGVPYIKFGVVLEKYKPTQYPDDLEMVDLYKDDDITKYDKLPAAIIQEGTVMFNIGDQDSGCRLDDLDSKIYNQCIKQDIRQLAFTTIIDTSTGMCTGCLIAYSFTSKPLDIQALENAADIIQGIYKSVLTSLDNSEESNLLHFSGFQAKEK